MSETSKVYEPGNVEKNWYEFWLREGFFTPRIDPDKRPFAIVMPLPNVTGDLHLGHALFVTLQDIMSRWHRMKGDPVLWLPGTDHAGIATQVVVERQLARQGKTKEEIGRDRFTEMVWEWAGRNRADIRSQLQMMGASCDWTREKFTLDEGPTRAVMTAFVRLYEKGLIYRGERMINWCPRCRTAISDLEVEHEDVAGHLYYIRYPLKDDYGFITVATTRPETFLGDTAVAVNPEDERYRVLIGRSVTLPLIDRDIPVIADAAVDISFGTGALKITPAHDPTDLEIARRHDLPLLNVMNLDATMNENAGPYRGLDRSACRERILADLKNKDLLERIEPYSHSVGHCSRCQTMVEPRVSMQWFVRTQPLAEAAIDVVRNGRVRIIPERFTNVYFDWMENIRDWCISRQLWWGHRIPVWYCQDCGKVTAAVDEPRACAHCESGRIVQDPDVLDTWFSSALWTHSTLGWPEDTDDLRYFYPGSVMETGYDILFFWVARMIMMGLENTGEIPFGTVYLHGLLRDTSGEKMSRSRLQSNAVNPAEPISTYGVDALRFALTTGTAPGNDMSLGRDKLESGRNFVNKLWNVTRFILRTLDAETTRLQPDWPLPETIEDRWIMSELNRLIANVTGLMEDFQFGEAEQQIYDFVWSRFCDWYVEAAKIRLRSKSGPSPVPFLLTTLEKCLRLLHPFMPFVTEELWQRLRTAASSAPLPHSQLEADGVPTPYSIVIAPYPVADDTVYAPDAEQAMDSVIEIIRSIRNVRAQYRVDPTRWIEARVYCDELLASLATEAEVIQALARVRPLTILSRLDRQPDEDKAVALVLAKAEVVLPLSGMTDQVAERQRLLKESEEVTARIASLGARLKDDGFLSKAPPQVVEKEKEKLAMLEDRLKRLHQELG
jgi:valyl-tRNA synthetase